MEIRADLISREAAIDYLMTNMGWRDEDGYEVDDADEKRAIITDLVNGIPAMNAAPVVSAHYVEGSVGEWYCSNCKRIDEKYSVARYCWYCGARMDGERRNSE